MTILRSSLRIDVSGQVCYVILGLDMSRQAAYVILGLDMTAVKSSYVIFWLDMSGKVAFVILMLDMTAGKLRDLGGYTCRRLQVTYEISGLDMFGCR